MQQEAGILSDLNLKPLQYVIEIPAVSHTL